MPVYLARRWRRQPSGALTVDWDNPLAQAIGLYLAWNGTTPRLRFRAPTNTLVNSTAAFDGPAIKNSARGVPTLGASMTAANSPDIDLGALPTLSQYTLLSVFSQGTVTDSFPVTSRSAGFNPGVELLSNHNADVGRSTARVTVNGTQYLTAIKPFTDGLQHNILATWISGGNLSIFSDTPSLNSSVATAVGTVTHSQNFRIGVRGTNRWTGVMSLVLFGTKQNLNASLQLLENPWQIFVPQTNAIISLGSAPSDFTLSADLGTYNFTGADATLARGQFLSADFGAYSLVGSDATLNRTRSLSADSGAYSLTGADATLFRSLSLSADSGSYQIDGKDASLTRTKVISADSGSYVVDGKAAEFIRTYNLLADAGAFNVTGSDATLLTAKTFSVEAGAYSLTGASANLIKFALYPDPGDVRAGVVYGPGGIYTGTLQVSGKVIYIFDD